ncbi:MAG: alanine racemase [Polyangiaceae bacterium]
MASYTELREALAGRPLPLAFVDLDAFDRNVDRVVALLAERGTPLRVATKSLRAVGLLRRILERAGDAARGLMCFTVGEAAFLVHHGFDDLLIAYPTVQARDLELAAALTESGHAVHLMADSAEAVARIGAVGAARGVELGVVLDVDMSLRLGGGRLHLGVWRSPLWSADEVVDLARAIEAHPGTRFLGIMGYEAQVAGLGDHSPHAPLLNPVIGLVRAVSRRELGPRRATIVAALRDAGLPPHIVNGGGTGSLDSTTPDTGVTEVTAGSAFFKPHLFDHFASPHMLALEPAAFFALQVTRRPGPGLVTCLGGGYVASGAASIDKVPLPWLPEGAKLLSSEMAGEVQTPVALPEALDVALGDPIVFRHAKAGELAERFERFELLAGGRIVDRVPTYRGEGQCFL